MKRFVTGARESNANVVTAVQERELCVSDKFILERMSEWGWKSARQPPPVVKDHSKASTCLQCHFGEPVGGRGAKLA